MNRSKNIRFISDKLAEEIKGLSSSAAAGAKKLTESAKSIDDVLSVVSENVETHLDSTFREFGKSITSKYESIRDAKDNINTEICSTGKSELTNDTGETGPVLLPPDYEKVFLDEKNARNYEESFAKKTKYSDIFVFCAESDETPDMYLLDYSDLVDLFHTRDKDECLIFVDKGKCASGIDYCYALTKNKRERDNCLPDDEYHLRLYLYKEEKRYVIFGMFNELGIPRKRDDVVLRIIINEYAQSGEIKSEEDILESVWYSDPYGVNSSKKYLMNESEKEKYDNLFPEYPISQARKLANYIIENN